MLASAGCRYNIISCYYQEETVKVETQWVMGADFSKKMANNDPNLIIAFFESKFHRFIIFFPFET